MNTPQRSPIDQFNADQSSLISQPGYRQAQIPYQIPKIDHAFIIQNYRRLRIHQREVLTHLRMPDDLKRKIFNFRQDQDLRYEKADLVIFNHPFRGKTVMTREEVEKQLEKQRKNAEFGEEKQSKGQKVQQNILNQMGLQQEQVTLKKAKMTEQKPQQDSKEYERKTSLFSKKPKDQIAEEINKEQEEKLKGEMYFISKERKNQETEKQRTEKMKQLIKEKEDRNIQSNKPKQKSHQKDKKPKDFKDMPIIGQEPVVVRDIKFDEKIEVKMKDNAKEKPSSKGFYRPFGDDMEIKEFQKPKLSRQQEDHRLGSENAFKKKQKQADSNQFQRNGNRSLSEISAIESKNFDEDLSNSQSLNNALFLE